MSTVQKFNNDVAPWLRLATPVLLAFVMYFLNQFDSKFTNFGLKLEAVATEQARRTVKVNEAYRKSHEHVPRWGNFGDEENK